MLTPTFQLEQNDKFLTIRIRAPHCKLADAEISYSGNVFLFHASPYFLRLFLTGEVVDDENGTCNYNCDEGRFTICMPKKQPGEYFPKLEMLSELLRPQKQIPNAQRLVEIVGSNKENQETMDESKIEDEEIEEEGEESLNEELFYAEQRLSKDEEEKSSSSANFYEKFGYGFGWTRHGILGRFKEEIEELINLDESENVPINERLVKLAEFDEKHFQEQHYLADLFSPEQLQFDAMDFILNKEEHLTLNEEDRTELKDLKIRQLEQFPKEITEQIALSLIDLLFGFHYDLRTTLAEHNVESGWTISKLSPSLTFLVRWPNMRGAIIGTVRHSLVLPLIRNWDLSNKVLGDVLKTLQLDRTAILHCLLACRRIFNRSGDFRYLFNQLFLDDLCLWIQSIPDEILNKLRDNFKTEIGSLKKSDLLELDLEFIEAHARLEMMKPMDSDDEPENEEIK